MPHVTHASHILGWYGECKNCRETIPIALSRPCRLRGMNTSHTMDYTTMCCVKCGCHFTHPYIGLLCTGTGVSRTHKFDPFPTMPGIDPTCHDCGVSIAIGGECIPHLTFQQAPMSPTPPGPDSEPIYTLRPILAIKPERPQCLDCKRELCDALDAYYGYEARMIGLCVTCRFKK